MDHSGQYHRRAQMDGLPMNFQYTGTPVLASQAPHRMLSFDGLPRTNSNQQFMSAWPKNLFSGNFNASTPMPLSQTPSQWTGQAHHLPDFNDPNPSDHYGYSTTQQGSGSDGGFQRSQNYSDVPRTWPSPYEPRMAYDNTMVPKTYEPAAYMIDPDKDSSQTTSAPGPGLGYDTQESSRDFARLSISRSPKIENDIVGSGVASFDKSPGFVLPSRESSDDSGNSSREMTVADVEDHGVDEPYAKLIHRALMSAPNHSMVLQEIYQWFRDNTSKGSSDTKGWMNSIRHNLSMNAAFKKTERKVSGDETKKSTEWVLEDFAIKDGVQSTTRYRKGTGNKKFTKSEIPAPSRQSSGRKGGICASKTKFSRQKVKDDRSDPRRSIQRPDTGRYPYQHQSRSQMTQRQVSPMTPCAESLPSASPYFFTKSELFEVPYEDMCLGDVQGLYDEDGPLFSNGHDSPFHTSHPMCTSQHY